MAVITTTLQLNMTALSFGTLTGAANYTQQVSYSTSHQKLGDSSGLYSREISGTFTAATQGTVTSLFEYVNTDPTQIFRLEGFSSSFDQLNNSVLVRFSGNDTVTGSVHADVIRGFSGSDSLNGGAGNDTIYGGEGQADSLDNSDSIMGGFGRDLIFGNAGNDTIYGDVAGSDDGDVDNIFGGLGRDVIYGGGGGDYLAGGGGVAHPEDQADTIFGGAGDDFILGNGDNDLLYGGLDSVGSGSGHDRIFGGLGNDTIYGGDGHDTIVGQSGNDVLYGGAGTDRFVFLRGDGNDTIYDFQNGTDILMIANNLQNGVHNFETLAAASQTVVGGLMVMLHDGIDQPLSIFLPGITSLSASSVQFVEPDWATIDFLANLPNFLGHF